jgi:hypothetical protein
MTLGKIVSGGQTGVDRGALDAALAVRFPAGGWCPSDRAAEDGEIPARYPLSRLDRGGYRARTLRNVQDSDGTAILAPGRPSGGTRLTLTFCRQHEKPLIVLDALQLSEEEAALELIRFIDENHVRTLNVAGPRASHWSSGHTYARDTITALLARVTAVP